MLGAHARLLREAAARHGGYEVHTYGDAFFIAFSDAGEAIAAAVEAQRSLLSFPWLHGSPVLVRMGLHTGTAATVDADYVGIDVHARHASPAPPMVGRSWCLQRPIAPSTAPSMV